MSEYITGLDRWLQCPNCGSEAVTFSIGYDGELKIECNDCESWTTKV